MRAMKFSLGFWLALGIALSLLPGFASSQAQSAPVVTSPATAPGPAVDPFKEGSEFNHHMAGFALIGVGVLVLAGYRFPQLRVLPYVWPALFLLAGLFLALWSDGEMWPRGNLSWAWLIHHDQEARQHKIYALLLMAMGVVEYLRARGALNRFWRVWAFPILAVVGASLLLIHDHSQGSGARSPEARAYYVDPTRDQDGHPLPASTPDPMAGMDHSAMDMDHAHIDHSQMDHSAMSHAEMDSMDHSGMDHSQMDHSSMPPAADAAAAATGHHHHMTPSMLLVEHEHFWFMIVGLGIALFKLISDADIWRRSFVPYIWPAGMVLLGVLLVFYRE